VNIKNILNKSTAELANKGIPTPELDARILLLGAIKKESVFVFSHPEYIITNSEYSRFRSYIRRRKKGEPVAYILGQKEFYGNNFIVNKNVLIPRPETEWLVEQSVAFLQNKESRIKNYGKFNVLDIGTGSGCIIISIVKNLQTINYQLSTINYSASDLSQKAIRIARKNSKLNNAKNIKFYFSDLFSNRFLNKKFDLIIANLPYVPRSARIQNTVYRTQQSNSHPEHIRQAQCKLREGSSEAIFDSVAFEPKDAIFASDNGMAIIKKFLIEAKTRVNEGGMILLEADCRNAKKILKFAKQHYPSAKIKLEKDLAGLDRYIIIKK
jgi:release factor glutamine methyltransferase